MKLFVGLGNPGPRYAANRHNIGFMAVDRIHERWNFPPWRKRFHGQVSEGRIDGERVILLKPETYMNNSGQSVGEAMRYYRLDAGDVIVFHDELDLPPGRVRWKAGGGHGGHNGLRSIVAHVGADFARVRLGIGHPGAKERVTGWVLGDFARTDRDWLDPLLDAIADAAPHLARGDGQRFMNAVNVTLGRERGAGGSSAKTQGSDTAPGASPARARGSGTAAEGERAEQRAEGLSPLERLRRHFTRR